MIYATVEFPITNATHAKAHADLTDGGWKLRGSDFPELDSLVNGFAGLSQFGPADGDPVACAAAAAARLLSGVVTYVREPDPVPSDAVF